MKRKSSIPEEKLLPYETICAATRGDPDAMTKVLRHFDGYISYPKYVVTTNSLDVGNENGIRIVHLADFLLDEQW